MKEIVKAALRRGMLSAKRISQRILLGGVVENPFDERFYPAYDPDFRMEYYSKKEIV